MSQLTRIVLFPVQLAGVIVKLPEAIDAVVRLPEILATMNRIAETTVVLGEVRDALVTVADHTDRLNEVSAATVAMERTTTSISGYVPALADLQDMLPPVVPLLEGLAETMNRLEVRLGELDRTVDNLAVAVTPLGAATQRLRLAGRQRRAMEP